MTGSEHTELPTNIVVPEAWAGVVPAGSARWMCLVCHASLTSRNLAIAVKPAATVPVVCAPFDRAVRALKALLRTER